MAVVAGSVIGPDAGRRYREANSEAITPLRRDHPDVDQRNWWEIDPEVTFVCDPGMRNGVALGRGVGMQGRGPAPCSAFTTRWQLTAEEGEVAYVRTGVTYWLGGLEGEVIETPGERWR